MALSRFRVRFVDEAATAIAGLVLLAWFLIRARLPLTAELIGGTNELPQPSVIWRVDEVAWQLSAWLLLLVVGGLLVRLGRRYAARRVEGVEPHAQEWPVSALALWLAAAAMMIFWADSLAGVMVSWMLFILAWGAALIVSSTAVAEELPRTIWGLGWLMLSLAFLWLAAANLPAGTGQDLVMENWPTVATSSVLTAALLQMGVWPFHAWRMTDRRLAPLLGAMIHIVPAQAGSALLVRLVATSDVSMGYSLFLTAFSLLGILLVLYRAWGHLHAPARIMAALALAQTSLLLLAGAWAGPEALMAETRVMVLAVGILFLVAGESAGRFSHERTAAVGLAVAAAAGIPLTAGFLGRAALYDAWLGAGRFTLLLVTSLMHLPLITVLLIHCWPRRAQTDNGSDPPALGGRLALAAGLLLPAVGTLSLRRVTPGRVSVGAWLAVLVPAVLSLVAFGFLGDLREARKAVYSAFSLNLTFIDDMRQAGLMLARHLNRAVREAAAILEGEGGMLWLLVLVIVFLLAR